MRKEREGVGWIGERTATGGRRTETAERTRGGVTPTLMLTPMRMVAPPEATVILLKAIPPMDMVIPLMVTAPLMEEEMPGPANPPRPSELVTPTTLTRFREWTKSGLTVEESLVTEEVWPSKRDPC